MPPTTPTPEQLLKQHWKHSTFRPLQQEIITHVMQGQDLLALMPTGGGKSLCYQLPALLQPGITLVVSPLIALIQDQITQLQQINIAAAAILSSMSKDEIHHTLQRCLHDETLKLLYISPERLTSPRFITYLRQMHIARLTVDEAHCIAQWGHDFRPAYLEIPQIRKHHPQLPILALTATATPAVREEIQEQLQMRSPILLKTSFTRPNLSYVVRQTPNKERTLRTILQQVPGSTIIYTDTRLKTQQIAAWLNKHQISADYYHAGLAAPIRKKKQAQWTQDVKRVLVATDAFGMGINKANVRLVIHQTPPATLESYYQEAGRAGRDGQRSYAVLLCHSTDFENLFKRVERTNLSPQYLRTIYQLLANYYQVAIRSHAGVTYPWDAQHFAIRYELPLYKVTASIQQLAASGLIAVNDQWATPPKLHIKLRGEQLYTFQQSHPQAKQLLQQINTNHHTAPFHHFQPISLKGLAHQLKTTPQAVAEQLKTLHELDIIAYSPPGKAPTLTFLTPRYPIDELPLNHQAITKRNTSKKHKAKALAHYANHPTQCRTLLLLAYFGETSRTPCAICDNCIAKKKPPSWKADYAKYSPIILSHLHKEPLPLHLLAERVPTQHLTPIIQQMLQEDHITYNSMLQLVPTR